MSAQVGFTVIYRFEVHPDKEASFITGWSQMTEAIRDQRGGLGSRLHRSEDGAWVAYAQWPDREAWERSRKMDSPHEEAGRLMADAMISSAPPVLLDPVMDLLELRRAVPSA